MLDVLRNLHLAHGHAADQGRCGVGRMVREEKLVVKLRCGVGACRLALDRYAILTDELLGDIVVELRDGAVLGCDFEVQDVAQVAVVERDSGFGHKVVVTAACRAGLIVHEYAEGIERDVQVDLVVGCRLDRPVLRRQCQVNGLGQRLAVAHGHAGGHVGQRTLHFDALVEARYVDLERHRLDHIHRLEHAHQVQGSGRLQRAHRGYGQWRKVRQVLGRHRCGRVVAEIEHVAGKLVLRLVETDDGIVLFGYRDRSRLHVVEVPRADGAVHGVVARRVEIDRHAVRSGGEIAPVDRQVDLHAVIYTDDDVVVVAVQIDYGRIPLARRQ